jgi:hypothetical protein
MLLRAPPDPAPAQTQHIESLEMKTFLVALTIAASCAVFAPAFADETVPCEDMLSKVRTELADAKLSAADQATIKDLVDKGIERCNADDDERADGFFAQAMKLLGK